jgi:hypothetical protein
MIAAGGFYVHGVGFWGELWPHYRDAFFSRHAAK